MINNLSLICRATLGVRVRARQQRAGAAAGPVPRVGAARAGVRGRGQDQGQRGGVQVSPLRQVSWQLLQLQRHGRHPWQLFEKDQEETFAQRSNPFPSCWPR